MFLAVWLCGWLWGELAAIRTLLWGLGGKEFISVDNFALKLKRDVFGYGSTREFYLREAKRLRVSSDKSGSKGVNFVLGRRPGETGTVAFDYGAKTYRFAEGIDEAEAYQLVLALKRRFPSLDETA
jgi:hypothetical protein